ncbi:MAG: hypothetical protein KatS3mg118_1230 [Paracoccaceae bacterium]|nr:MAG: hypothetical protein KatS3mg118_1230 [Paracoccaceae bacterium]
MQSFQIGLAGDVQSRPSVRSPWRRRSGSARLLASTSAWGGDPTMKCYRHGRCRPPRSSCAAACCRRGRRRRGAGLPAEAARAQGLARVAIRRTRLANIADLKVERARSTSPIPTPDSPGVLLKLGRPVEGGVGPDGDIVAFSVLCPHKGWLSVLQRRRQDPELPGPPFALRLRGGWPADLGSCDAEPAAVPAAGGRQGRHPRRGRGRADLRPPVQRARVREGGPSDGLQAHRSTACPSFPRTRKEFNVTCHYCIVGCGYKAYTWPINRQGGTGAGREQVRRRL